MTSTRNSETHKKIYKLGRCVLQYVSSERNMYYENDNNNEINNTLAILRVSKNRESRADSGREMINDTLRHPRSALFLSTLRSSRSPCVCTSVDTITRCYADRESVNLRHYTLRLFSSSPYQKVRGDISRFVTFSIFVRYAIGHVSSLYEKKKKK